METQLFASPGLRLPCDLFSPSKSLTPFSYAHRNSSFHIFRFRSAKRSIIINEAQKSTSVASTDPPLRIPKWASSLCDAADDFIDNYLDKPLRPSVDPSVVLSGNFAPVEETPPTECLKIEGTLPRCLNGVYIRNGPNPRYLPRRGHHIYDGDGMLHAIRIKDGRATFCSRFVHTDKFLQEENAGKPLFPKVFSGFYGFAGMARVLLAAIRGALRIIDHTYASGLANTSVVFFHNTLMALGESGMPYAFHLTENGDIRNTGRHDFGGKLKLGMTAHPKIDPSTGEMFAFRYGFPPPFLNFFRVDPNGVKQPDVPVSSMNRPIFVHDLAITASHALIPETQIVVNPMAMVLRNGSPIVCDMDKIPRLGVMPRYADDDSDIRWFEVPGLNIIHTVNAWEEEGGEEVVLIASNTKPAKYVLEENHLLRMSLEEVRINLKTATVSRRRLSLHSCLELGVINPGYVGKKNRYAYMAIGAPFPKVCGVAKVDFSKAGKAGSGAAVAEEEECIVARRVFGENWFGGEACFVGGGGDEEDDGYIVSYIHNEATGVSKVVVMDARSPELEMVGSVELPARVPYGFHGLFVTEKLLS